MGASTMSLRQPGHFKSKSSKEKRTENLPTFNCSTFLSSSAILGVATVLPGNRSRSSSQDKLDLDTDSIADVSLQCKKDKNV